MAVGVAVVAGLWTGDSPAGLGAMAGLGATFGFSGLAGVGVDAGGTPPSGCWVSVWPMGLDTIILMAEINN